MSAPSGRIRRVRPAVPVPSGWEANKPGGLTLYTDAVLGNLNGGMNGGAGENTLNSDGLRAYGEPGANPGLWQNTTDGTAPYGSGVTDWLYPEGSLGNGGNNVYLSGDSAQTSNNWVRVYFSMAVFFSSNYSMHTNGEKFFYPIISFPTEASVSPVMQLTLLSDETHDGPTIGWYFNSQIGGAESLYTQPTANSVRVQKGVWQIVEMYAQLNTVGNADGVWKVWVDGAEAVNATGLRFTPAARTEQGGIDYLRFVGTRGGGPSDHAVPTGGQYRRFNRLSFYGSSSF